MATKWKILTINVLPVVTIIDHPETTAALDTSNNTLGDKSAFSYRSAFDKVTYEIVRNNYIPIMVESVMQLQHEIVPHSIANQSNEEEGTDSNAVVLDIYWWVCQ